jgi:hypothetical protein
MGSGSQSGGRAASNDLALHNIAIGQRLQKLSGLVLSPAAASCGPPKSAPMRAMQGCCSGYVLAIRL